jgi:hypothetical protein
MALDIVIGERTVAWLGTEQDKVAHFLRVTPLRREELPQLVFKSGVRSTTRFFPDKLPIGVHPGADKHEFLYVVTRRVPIDLRPFLYRHSTLLRMLPAWRLRLLVPAHLAEAAERFHGACEQELGTRLAPSTVEELRWYFGQRRELAKQGQVVDLDRYRRARRAFGGPRYHVLYRHWLTSGDSLLTSLDSPVLPDALAQGTGRIEPMWLHDGISISPPSWERRDSDTADAKNDAKSATHTWRSAVCRAGATGELLGERMSDALVGASRSSSRSWRVQRRCSHTAPGGALRRPCHGVSRPTERSRGVSDPPVRRDKPASRLAPGGRSRHGQSSHGRGQAACAARVLAPCLRTRVHVADSSRLQGPSRAPGPGRNRIARTQ